jgi:hypothetical protein
MTVGCCSLDLGLAGAIWADEVVAKASRIAALKALRQDNLILTMISFFPETYLNRGVCVV